MQIKNAKGVGLINAKGVATMQIKNRFFCPQYSLHVLTSDVRSLLPLPDSTCYCCVIMHSVLLWWSKIKK